MSLINLIQEQRKKFHEEYPSAMGVSGAVYFVMQDPVKFEALIATIQKQIIEDIHAEIKDLDITEMTFGGFRRKLLTYLNDALKNI